MSAAVEIDVGKMRDYAHTHVFLRFGEPIARCSSFLDKFRRLVAQPMLLADALASSHSIRQSRHVPLLPELADMQHRHTSSRRSNHL